MSRRMRIGTRKSALALAQTRLFVEACRAAAPDADISYEIVEMSTSGDRLSDRPLYEFAGKGMFISAFEEALAAGEIDAAVHSGKDVPALIPEGLTIAAVLPRAHPGDVLITLPGRELTEQLVVGTGSLRRQEQIRLYLGCKCRNIRGNVGTRLEKLRAGQVDALLLAAAGLERLSLLPCGGWSSAFSPVITDICTNKDFTFRRLDIGKFLPAAAQGIIAVESRQSSPFTSLFELINDRDTMRCFLTERAYLAGVGADCHQPVAAFSYCRDKRIYLDAAYWKDGRMLRYSGDTQLERGEILAASLAEKTAEQAMTAAAGETAAFPAAEKAAGKAAPFPAEKTTERAEKTTKGQLPGHVYLVGAGPGSGDLITVRGLDLLRKCDIVVYDRLAGEELLMETKSDCEKIYVGKRAGYHSMPQEDINSLLIEKAREGKMVVRLKGGDPFVFGRGGEEAESLMAAGIPFTAVPGVTTAVAAAELAGIPVTHREISRSFHVITGHTAETEPEKRKAYLRRQIAGLKDAEGTLVFLMGLSAIDTICGLLLETGKPAHLPAAVISRGSRYDERVIRGTLADIGEKVKREKPASPAIILVGETAALSLKTKTAPPLCGVRVGMTGTDSLMARLGKGLRAAGAETLCIQRLLIRWLDTSESCFERLTDYTWLIFTSANGVTVFFENLAERKMDIRMLQGIRIAVIGSGTARRLADFGIYPDYMPQTYTAEDLAAGLLRYLRPDRDRVLLYQARGGNPVLEETWRKAGISTERAESYAVEYEKPEHMEELPTLTYLTFGSASGVAAFCSENPDIFREGAMGRVRAAAIGSRTARALREAGCKEVITASTFTAEGLIQAIIDDRKDGCK